jgi:hypothetical protein
MDIYKKIMSQIEESDSQTSAEKNNKDWQKVKYVDERTSLLSG